MFQAIVRQATSAYRPLPAHLPGDTGVKYTGKMVHETQLNCFYIPPGGKNPKLYDVPISTGGKNPAFYII